MTVKKMLVTMMTLLLVIITCIAFHALPLEAKISGEVKDELLSGSEKVELLIYMKDQVDTKKVAEQAQKTPSARSGAEQYKKETRQAVAKALKINAASSQASLLQYLENKKSEGLVADIESYYIVNILSATVATELVLDIAKRPDVSHIELNSIITLEDPDRAEQFFTSSEIGIPWNIEQIGAPQVWNHYGADGSGVVIGIIDTGVDWKHPALQASWRGNNNGSVDPDYNWYDPIDNREEPEDQNGHGTYVIGIALGRDQAANKHIGVAPGAQWIAARGMNDIGSGRKSHLLAAGQFMLAPTDRNGENANPDFAPDVVINAWGARYGVDDWYLEMVNNWRNAMIFSVFSAGNSGDDLNAVLNPANYREAFAVGATDSNNNLARFSSRGPGIYGDFIKPDLVAPGVGIYTSALNNEYKLLNGTSLSAPHVAGVVALLWSIDPGLSIADLEKTLKQTALPLSDRQYPVSPNYSFGYGLVNALAAVDSISYQHNILTVTVQSGGTTDPIPGIYSYPQNQVVNFNALPRAGWQFDKWDINGTAISTPKLILIMSRDRTAKAYFSEIVDAWIVLDSPEEPVALDGAWRINFNRFFSIDEVEEVYIERNQVMVPIRSEALPEDLQMIITPRIPYKAGERYCLRIILNNSKYYKMYFDTKDILTE